MIFNELDPGTSVEGQPIPVYRSDAKGDKYFYLMGGTHGDEVEGVYCTNKLFDWLKEQENLPEIPMIVIPVLNVDGYRAGSRVNAHAVDLNRNYPTDDWSPEFKKDKYNPGPNALSEPENIFLDKLFQKFPPAWVLSFHSWKAMINYNGDCKDVADFIGNHNQYEVVPDVGYSTPGSLGTYVPNKYDAGVITFECPVLADGHTLEGIWAENEKGLKELFSSQFMPRSN